MLNRIEDYFLVRISPDSGLYYFRARILVKFTLVSTLFAFGYWVNTFFTGFLVARYLMLGGSILFILQLFGLRRGISLTLISQFFVSVCWAIVVILTVCSLGIRSPVLMWITLIPIMAMLLMGRRVGLVWGAVGLLTVLFFFYAGQRLAIPVSWLAPQSNLLTTSLHIGLLTILLFLNYVFHRQGGALLDTIRDQKRIIEEHKNEMARRNESLEEEVDKRTRELLDYNQQLEQFAFIASHNLRAPVAGLLGLGQLLEISMNRKEEVEQICRNMVTTARELDRVVRDLSTILEIRKASHAVLTDIDLVEELQLVRVSLEREFVETGAKVETDFSQVAVIQTVRPLMDSILMNLISNAIKYRHPGRAPLITLKTSLLEGEVCLTVSDNGLGMDLAEYGDKLFTLYGRFHSHVDGKGLGLYLVKTHVMAMGGRIEVESEVDKGATFRVFLRHTERKRE